MDLATSLLNCLCGCEHNNAHFNSSDRHDYSQNHTYGTITEKAPLLEPPPTPTHPTTPVTTHATQILAILLHAPIPSPNNNPTATDLTPLLLQTTNPTLTTTSWTSLLAEHVLHGLEDALQGDHSTWGDALREAYARASELARAELASLWAYAQDHPYEVAASVLLTVLALGVLGRLVPGLVRVLGFGRLGPVEGSFAAWWQQLYRGNKSIASFVGDEKNRPLSIWFLDGGRICRNSTSQLISDETSALMIGGSSRQTRIRKPRVISAKTGSAISAKFIADTNGSVKAKNEVGTRL
ncbi:predicted protein [Chaetomium globosum CBS 148.51]|uniref:Uncharacterized protein n=1 Tax=Chaetomium globosum (strain ATCC 6205 / CBS 148.51 / DSM 1962 / NBRC 6347 / NRRL 1970) TaxID=306901 RepID=Q2GYU9_CHAGB|nr:uncharacterized protein CHGG_06855 [Chaetomium globosum CBS 148.51]EAQ85602.1 predicted protein [Chaetomium globosum CBS 148.51]